MTMMFEARDAQLTASFSFKSRSAPTIEEVLDEDCLESPNTESIHQPILVDLKRKESVSTPLNPPPSQANSIPLYTTLSEQMPQPGNGTAQPQNNVIPLPTPSLTFPKPNIVFLKPCPHSSLPPYSFPPNISQNRYKGPHKPQSPSHAAKTTPIRDTQNPPPPELSNNLNIRIISTASFAQIIQEGAQAY
ncbi:hypothetical protein C0995_001057 [Termitomyces sp. Mi166|nr:hypothetical protein C0995_001057 [Termitomyces sp. Mi166\